MTLATRSRAAGWAMAITLAVGIVLLLARLDFGSPRAWAVAVSAWLALGLLPILALARPELLGERSLRRLLWAALGVLAGVAVLEALIRATHLTDLLVLQAIDQIGDIRLAALRPDGTGAATGLSIAAQTALVFPWFALVTPLLMDGVPLRWPLAFAPVMNVWWTVAAAWVVWRAPAARTLRPGVRFVFALAIGSAPALLDKASWDFIAPTLLLVLLAYVAEEAGRRRTFYALLVLAALSHPVNGVMAALWAVDHARRTPDWRGDGAARFRVMVGPAIVTALGAVPGVVVVFGRWWFGADAINDHVAFFARHMVEQALAAGHWSWIPAVLGVNLFRLGVILAGIGFLSILRPNRFLIYAAVELPYSLLTPNGFFHGSLAGFLGLLACAALDNVGRVRTRELERSAWIAAALLLPLTLWWSGRHLVVTTLGNVGEARAPALVAAVGPDDRERVCVGGTRAYLVLAGECAASAPLRFADGAPSTIARAADVYLISLRDAADQGRPGPRGLFDVSSRVAEMALRRGPESADRFDLRTEVATPDLAWIRDDIVAGRLRVVRHVDGVVRLEPAPSSSPGAPPESAGVSAAAVVREIESILSERRRPR